MNSAPHHNLRTPGGDSVQSEAHEHPVTRQIIHGLDINAHPHHPKVEEAVLWIKAAARRALRVQRFSPQLRSLFKSFGLNLSQHRTQELAAAIHELLEGDDLPAETYPAGHHGDERPQTQVLLPSGLDCGSDDLKSDIHAQKHPSPAVELTSDFVATQDDSHVNTANPFGLPDVLVTDRARNWFEAIVTDCWNRDVKESRAAGKEPHPWAVVRTVAAESRLFTAIDHLAAVLDPAACEMDRERARQWLAPILATHAEPTDWSRLLTSTPPQTPCSPSPSSASSSASSPEPSSPPPSSVS